MFNYPDEPPVPKHGPSGYTDYSSYKPWLRDEFTFRCVYCLEREMWYPDRSNSFQVEHIVAKTFQPDEGTNYANLAYACGRCNSWKGTVPLLNPRKVALADHLRVGSDGQIEGATVEGWILVEQLHLRESPARDNRRCRIELQRLLQENPNHPVVQWLFLNEFGFPDGLPDLTERRPPSGNSRSGSELASYHAIKLRGELPDIY